MATTRKDDEAGKEGTKERRTEDIISKRARGIKMKKKGKEKEKKGRESEKETMESGERK